MAGAVSTVRQCFIAAGLEVFRLAGRGNRSNGLHPGWIFSGLFSVRFFAVMYYQQHGPLCFWLCFFHRYVFSTTSPLCFPVCSGLFLAPILCFQQLLRFVF